MLSASIFIIGLLLIIIYPFSRLWEHPLFLINILLAFGCYIMFVTNLNLKEEKIPVYQEQNGIYKSTNEVFSTKKQPVFETVREDIIIKH